MSILNVDQDVSYFIGGFGSGLDHPECITSGLEGYAYAGGAVSYTHLTLPTNREV